MNALNSTDDATQGVKIKLANPLRSLAWGHSRASFAALALNRGVYTQKGIFFPLGERTGLSAFAGVLVRVFEI